MPANKPAVEYLMMLGVFVLVLFGIWRFSVSWQIYFEHFPSDPWYYFFLK